MKLDEFVQSAIEQVVRGVVNSKSVVEPLGGRVNAYDHNMYTPQPETRTNLEFDVALVVSESQQDEGGAKVSMLNVFSIGGKTQSADAYQQTSRVKFTVPITLPKG